MRFANCGIPASHFKQGYSPDPSSSRTLPHPVRRVWSPDSIFTECQSSIPSFTFINQSRVSDVVFPSTIFECNLLFSHFFFVFLSLFLPPLPPHTQLDEYIALCREDIHIEIAVGELSQLHSLLLKYKEDIVSLFAPDEVHPVATLCSSPPLSSGEVLLMRSTLQLHYVVAPSTV